MTTANSGLSPVVERGWRRGFRNLFSNENNLRWGGRRWLSAALTWIAILNGFVLLVALANAQDGSMSPAAIASDCAQVFVSIGAIATAIGVVVGVQGSIVLEKQLGTAAWVLSKPVSRRAFILAKLLSHSFSFLSLSLMLPTVVYYAQSLILWKQLPAATPFWSAWLLVALHLLFYLALTLMLGTFYNARGPVSGISLGFLFSGLILPNILPEWIMLIFPWPFAELARALVAGKSIPSVWPIPVIATIIWTILFVIIALWRFEREEF
jgi:ABC-2 type transport system permease protein